MVPPVAWALLPIALRRGVPRLAAGSSGVNSRACGCGSGGSGGGTGTASSIRRSVVCSIDGSRSGRSAAAARLRLAVASGAELLARSPAGGRAGAAAAGRRPG